MSIYFIENTEELFPDLKDMSLEFPENEHIIYETGDPEADDILDMPLREARAVWEKEYIEHQLERCSGNVTAASVFMCMDRSALHRKCNLLGIDTEFSSVSYLPQKIINIR